MEELNIVKENRIGTFRISHELITDAHESLMDFFGNFIIVKAESIFHSMHIEYTGYSKLFGKNDIAVIPPKYLIIATREETEDGINISFTAEKQGE